MHEIDLSYIEKYYTANVSALLDYKIKFIDRVARK